MLLSEYLKEKTKKAHAFTEKTMDAKAIFSEDYSKDLYTLHLKQLLKSQSVMGLFIESSPHVNHFKNDLPSIRLSELKHDLLQINDKKVAVSISLKSKEIFNDLPAFVGMLYVIKGSELGRNIISKAINKHLNNWHKSEATFYREKNADQVRNSWIQFCSTLNNISSDQVFFDKAVAGANLAFDIYTRPEAFANITIIESE